MRLEEKDFGGHPLSIVTVAKKQESAYKCALIQAVRKTHKISRT
jgi:hypothetical protein